MAPMKKTPNPRLERFLQALLAADLCLGAFYMIRLHQKSREEAVLAAEPTVSSAPVLSTPAASAVSTAVPLPADPYFSNLSAGSVSWQADNETGFTTGWSILAASGSMEMAPVYDGVTLQVYDTGNAAGDLYYYRDGVPITAGTYTLYFQGSSTLDRTLTAVVLNPATGQVYGQQDFSLNETMQDCLFSFSVPEGQESYNARIALLTGSEQALAQHTVQIHHLCLVSEQPEVDIRINQVGYPSASAKRCTFIYDAGDFFDVINAADGSTVYTGAILGKAYYEASGETDAYGDFSSLLTPGTYYIRSQIGTVSPSFTISDTAYASLLEKALNVFYIQRCGVETTAASAGNLAHPACHTGQGTILYTTQTLDISGGWHDAGDYGRYTKTGAAAAGDLIYAWMLRPELFTASRDGLPAILAEAKTELEWLLKMQAGNGGLYARAVTASYANWISPELDDQEIVVMPVESASTAAAAAVFALASRAYAPYDSDFAGKCLTAAQYAWDWLASNPDQVSSHNPTSFAAGEYKDGEDADGRYYAAMSLYAATGDTSYLEAAKALYASDTSTGTGFSWRENGGYGSWLFLTSENGLSDDPDFYEQVYADFQAQGQQLLTISQSNGYGLSLSEFHWGSNYDAAGYGVEMMMVYSLTGDQAYLTAAQDQLSYLLGRNPLNLCYVTKMGYSSPSHLHSRLFSSRGEVPAGTLVGGPNADRDDAVSQQISSDTPPARIYADDEQSYATNEMSIYYNGALVLLAAVLS